MGIAAKSAIRALQVFELFEQTRSPLSLIEIATALEIPQSSTAALLKKLSDFDYLHYEIKSRTYLPTLRLSSLGDWLPCELMSGGVNLLGERLQEQTGETIAIAVQNELLVDYLDVQMASKHVDIFPPMERYPRGRIVVTSPLGWLLMDEFTEAQLERVYLRSIARSLIQRDEFPMSAFHSCIDAAQRSKYLLVLHWPYDNSSLLTTALPVRPFGRRLALGIGINITDLERTLAPTLESVDRAVAQLPYEHTDRALAGRSHECRLVTIDGRAGTIVSQEKMPPDTD